MRLSLRLCNRRAAHFIGTGLGDLKTAHFGHNAQLTVSNVLGVKKTLTVPEWSSLNDIFSLPGFSYQAVSVIMEKNCGLEEARKLKSALEKSGPLNPIAKAQMLRAYGFFSSEVSKQDHLFIEETIKEVLSKFSIIPHDLSVYLLRGLLSFPSWKDKADLIISKTAEVKSFVFSLYAELAFEHNEFDLGWNIMEKATIAGKNFVPSLYECIVNKHESNPKQNLIFKLLDFLQKHSYMLPSQAAEQISHILNSSDKFVVRFTQVALRGHCTCCKRRLKKIPLTEEERQQLMIDLEERFDLKCKFSTYEKEEVERFKEFLNKCPPFTLVIDGLNMFYKVALKTSGLEMISTFVSNLSKQGHKILVIGRFHLKNNKKFCNIFKSHMMFFLNDKTRDDTFTIYSALHNGPNTFVLSNDFYGNYYSSMEGKSKMLFRKWQLSQHVVETNFRAANMVLPSITPITQKTVDGSSIHVPLVTNDAYKAFTPYAWLCIQQVSEEEKQRADRIWPHRPFIHKIEAELSVNAFKAHVHRLKNHILRAKDSKEV